MVDADTFSDPFGEQVQSFQLYAGITADGLIGPETFKQLHEAPAQRRLHRRHMMLTERASKWLKQSYERRP